MLLEQLEAGRVEVVGGLVKQQHVEAGQQDAASASRRACPPERPRSAVEAGRQPERRADLAGSCRQVGPPRAKVAVKALA